MKAILEVVRKSAPIYLRNWLILSFFWLLEVVDPSQEEAEGLQRKGFMKNTEEEVTLNRVANWRVGWERQD